MARASVASFPRPASGSPARGQRRPAAARRRAPASPGEPACGGGIPAPAACGGSGRGAGPCERTAMTAPPSARRRRRAIRPRPGNRDRAGAGAVGAPSAARTRFGSDGAGAGGGSGAGSAAPRSGTICAAAPPALIARTARLQGRASSRGLRNAPRRRLPPHRAPGRRVGEHGAAQGDELDALARRGSTERASGRP